MMIARKYVTSEEEKIPTYEEWLSQYNKDGSLSEKEVREQLTFTYTKPNSTDTILITWSLSSSLGTQDTQNIKMLMDEHAVKRCIVVIQGKITPFAAAAMRNLRILSYYIETFTEDELQFNVTKHEYVPRHIICSAAKKEEILNKYAITKAQLPQIKSTDPQVRYLGASKNQLIKILRPSLTMPSVTVPLPDGSTKVQPLYDITYSIVV